MGKTSVRGDFVAIEGHLFYWLTKSMNHRNAGLARALAPLECTVPQWRVMNMLRQRPGLSIAEISEKTAVDRTTLTRTIDGLEANSLLTRCVRADNRRIVELRLTRRGRSFYQRILPVVLDENARALEGIAVGEMAAAITLLKKLTLNLGGTGTDQT